MCVHRHEKESIPFLGVCVFYSLETRVAFFCVALFCLREIAGTTYWLVPFNMMLMYSLCWCVNTSGKRVRSSLSIVCSLVVMLSIVNRYRVDPKYLKLSQIILWIVRICRTRSNHLCFGRLSITRYCACRYASYKVGASMKCTHALLTAGICGGCCRKCTAVA